MSWPAFTIFIPVTAYHQRSYVETYSTFRCSAPPVAVRSRPGLPPAWSAVTAVCSSERDYGEVQGAASILGTAGGHHIPDRIHRHRKGDVIVDDGGAGNDLAPPLGPTGPINLDHDEVIEGTGVHGIASGHHIPGRIHRDRKGLIIAI